MVFGKINLHSLQSAKQKVVNIVKDARGYSLATDSQHYFAPINYHK